MNDSKVALYYYRQFTIAPYRLQLGYFFYEKTRATSSDFLMFYSYFLLGTPLVTDEH
ncbi:hypothetical protein [Maribacter sp. 2308TA10-17]|uniref:hypothetical protein n=1 Tax=Maribacter sp. 2308TA10-17 TaxID=3386276 RepID=UPI0039BD1728